VATVQPTAERVSAVERVDRRDGVVADRQQVFGGGRHRRSHGDGGRRCHVGQPVDEEQPARVARGLRLIALPRTVKAISPRLPPTRIEALDHRAGHCPRCHVVSVVSAFGAA
jgi:hypothetical protein